MPGRQITTKCEICGKEMTYRSTGRRRALCGSKECLLEYQKIYEQKEKERNEKIEKLKMQPVKAREAQISSLEQRKNMLREKIENFELRENEYDQEIMLIRESLN